MVSSRTPHPSGTIRARLLTTVARANAPTAGPVLRHTGASRARTTNHRWAPETSQAATASSIARRTARSSGASTGRRSLSASAVSGRVASAGRTTQAARARAGSSIHGQLPGIAAGAASRATPVPVSRVSARLRT